VPGKGNPRRTVRVDAETWDRFGRAARRLGRERATLLRDYIAWVLGEPGVEAPRQAPALAPDSEDDTDGT
jgi:hypothetical protein